MSVLWKKSDFNTFNGGGAIYTFDFVAVHSKFRWPFIPRFHGRSPLYFEWLFTQNEVLSRTGRSFGPFFKSLVNLNILSLCSKLCNQMNTFVLLFHEPSCLLAISRDLIRCLPPRSSSYCMKGIIYRKLPIGSSWNET